MGHGNAMGFQPNWWLAALMFGACALVTSQAQAGYPVARFRVTVDMVTSCTLGTVGPAADVTARIARLRIACSAPVGYTVGLDAARAQGARYRSVAVASLIEGRAPDSASFGDSGANAPRIFAVRRGDEERTFDADSGADGEPAIGILVSY